MPEPQVGSENEIREKDILAVSFSCMCLDWRELGFQGVRLVAFALELDNDLGFGVYF